MVDLVVKFQNLPFESPGAMQRSEAMTIGALQAVWAKRLKLSLFLFVMNGTEGFIPTPDQTLGDLCSLHGQKDQGKVILSISVAARMIQG